MERKTFGFGKRLKAAREKAGMSGTTLGIGAGENGKNASKASVSDWEHDRHYPKADQLRVICLKLNINVDDLIFGDIREELQMLQAESAIRALSDEQRLMLVERMTSKIAEPPEVVTNVTAQHVQPSHTLLPVGAGRQETVSRRDSEGFVHVNHVLQKEGNGSGHSPKVEGAKPPARKSGRHR